MTNQFLQLPALRPPIRPDQEWTLVEDWYSPELIGGIGVHIKAGFCTDGASIPRAAWRIVGHPFQVPLLGPALCHDAIYDAELVATHHEADWLFLEWMEMAGIGWCKRNTVWSAVRTCGGFLWDRHTPDSVKAAREYVSLTKNGRIWR
jgi:hypothetical protein